jgi:3-oxoadipate enol-lactonase
VGTLRVGDAELHYRLDGQEDAPALVLCNSLGADLRMWDPVVPALAARHRVLRHDARGHGRTPATPGPYTVELLGRDVAALVEGLGLSRPHLCGLSLGGMAALWLAAHAPGAVASLVLCNTAARMARPEGYGERIDRVREGGVEAVVETVLGAWFTPAFRAARPAELARAREMILGTSRQGYAAACAAVRDADLRGALPRVTAPTLVVVGTQDAATPPAAGRALAAGIAGARCLELPTAHLSALEAGPALAGAILSFLAGAPGAGAGSFTGGV